MWGRRQYWWLRDTDDTEKKLDNYGDPIAKFMSSNTAKGSIRTQNQLAELFGGNQMNGGR